MSLEIIFDPERKGGPFHVQSLRGVTLASFKNKTTAESYRRSALLQIALDAQHSYPEIDWLGITDRRDASEEETLP